MDNIIQVPIVDEVEKSFLDYSMSVITDRAIPSVEDGVKPVVRRILYDMLDKGLKNNGKYVKCATPVGDTISRFHPHGDSSVYGALVGISQPWNMRYPLIDFHGNNGSRDGDGPAAYRYTECKLSKIAEATMDGIHKDTVDWMPTFTEDENEPVYLPGRFPNLLCNGTTGIAVAMACSFAPHNLSEIMDAAIHYLNNKGCSIDDLLQFVKGPDFPTGGTIINGRELRGAYTSGKGKARIRAKYVVEKNKAGTEALVFTEIPYKVSKETLANEIDTLCEEGKISGITEIRDESNKEGVRFVLILQKGTSADILANQLFKLTDLETTYNINQVALVNKVPKQLSLLDIIKYYVEHQEDVYRRRNEFELKKIDDRIHILEGLSKAYEYLDAIIAAIKRSENKAAAKEELKKQWRFSDKQADAILAMTLSRLANMERIQIQDELVDKVKQHHLIFTRLNSPSKFAEDLTTELTSFKNQYGDARKTEITHIEVSKEEKEVAQIIPEDCVVILTEAGNVKRITTTSFKRQRRNGKGVKTQDDITKASITTNTVDVLLVFTNYGRVYRLPVDNIPMGTNSSRGVSVNSLVSMEPGEECIICTSMIRNEANSEKYIWFATKNGLIKKTNLKEYAGVKRKNGVQATNLREGDSIVSVWVGDDSDIVMISQEGMIIRFAGTSITVTGRSSTGIQGIKLGATDCVSVACQIQSGKRLLIVYQNGCGNKIDEAELTRQNRAGKGVKLGGTGISKVQSAITIEDDDMVLISGDKTSICLDAQDIKLGTRTNAPIKLIKDNKIVSIARV